MKNLKIWQKLALLAAVFMIPFLVVTYNLISSAEKQVESTRAELSGMDYSLPLLRLVHDLQQHRHLTNRVLSGRQSDKPLLQAKSAEVQNDLRMLDEIYARPDAEQHGGKRWEVLRNSARELVENGRSRSAETSFRAHSELIDDTAALVAEVADVSRLTLDPDRDSYYLMNVLLLQGPELSEYLSRVRSLGGVIVPGGLTTPEQLERLQGLSSLAGAAGRRLDDSLGKAIAGNPALKPLLQARAQSASSEVREARDYIDRLVSGQLEDVGSTGHVPDETLGPDALATLQAAVAPALTGLLNKRIDKFRHDLLVILGWAALAALLVLVIGFYIVRDITVPLKQVVGVANQIAVGNLNVETISGNRKDEIGVLSRAFDRMITSLREQVLLVQDIADGDLTGSIKPQSPNDDMGNALVEMVAHLSGLVSEVHKSGIQVNTSATQISATAREQHSTASEIAATTTQIGATSKEISATSKEMVRTMTEVADAAEQSATLAGSGQVGLTQMEETMHRVMEATGSINAKLAVLNEKAGNITQVVTTITRVADQTNLLSLNAAIEAEKAGEYGRGFSVVATEIRRLADQTAVATYDIEQMVKEIQSAVSAGVMGMDKFSEEVRRGMEEVQQVGAQLSQIIHQVQQMAPRCEAASEGMRAQATGAEQITQALSQLSEAALQTVESLRQSNQAIDGLHQSATGLREGVSRFKLGA